VVALSTCEAEYIAACSAACQALWLTALLKELKMFNDDTVELLVDSKSAIDLAKNQCLTEEASISTLNTTFCEIKLAGEASN